MYLNLTLSSFKLQQKKKPSPEQRDNHTDCQIEST